MRYNDTGIKVRYILRRCNSYLAKEVSSNHQLKIGAIESKMKISSEYLIEHPKIKVATKERNLLAYISRLKLSKMFFLSLNEIYRELYKKIDKEDLAKVYGIDNFYVIKVNLLKSATSKEEIHEHYKYLTQIEKVFMVSKTEHLKVRPIHVHIKEKTSAHFFIIMLVIKISRFLRYTWHDLNLNISEKIRKFLDIIGLNITIGEKKIPIVHNVNSNLKKVLTRPKVSLNEFLPYKNNQILRRKNLDKLVELINNVGCWSFCLENIIEHSI